MAKKVILICQECLSRNYSYHLGSNRINKIETKKYCQSCNKHTLHIETR